MISSTLLSLHGVSRSVSEWSQASAVCGQVVWREALDEVRNLYD